jgi:hypothetical protein
MKYYKIQNRSHTNSHSCVNMTLHGESSVADPDSHGGIRLIFVTPDPDPHQTEKSNANPHQNPDQDQNPSEKPDQDPHNRDADPQH